MHRITITADYEGIYVENNFSNLMKRVGGVCSMNCTRAEGLEIIHKWYIPHLGLNMIYVCSRKSEGSYLIPEEIKIYISGPEESIDEITDKTRRTGLCRLVREARLFCAF